MITFLKNNTDFTPIFDRINIPSGTYYCFGKKNTNYEKYKYKFVVTDEIKITKTSILGALPVDWYSGKYYLLQCEKKSVTINSKLLDNTTTVKVAKGSFFPYSDFMESDKALDFSKYAFCGLRLVGSDGTVGEENFDLSTKLVNDVSLCAVYQNVTSSSLELSNITSVINGTKNTNKNPSKNKVTLNIFKGNGNTKLNVSSDLTFNENKNVFYLGDETTQTIINENVETKFVLNNGVENYTMDVDASAKNFEPENSSHTRQYTIALANDLIIDGTFTIGGHVGTNTNQKYQSQINNEYVCLDLNGHNITVNSTGQLWSYGLIKDSVGTGRIIVKGGKLYTVATVMDYRGGSFTSSASGSANVFPFLCYEMPYIRAKVIFEYTSSGWGALIAMCFMTVQNTIDIGNMSHSAFELGFIGEENTFLFRPNSGIIEKSRLIFDGYTKSGISGDMCLQHRVGITMENMSLTMASLNFTIADIYKVDTSKYNFPVNSFFDIRLVNSTLLFGQRIQFMSGMSFIADKDSTVIFQSVTFQMCYAYCMTSV